MTSIFKEPKRKAFRRCTVIGSLDRLRTLRAWGKTGDKAGLSIIYPHDGKPMSVGNGSMVALQAEDPDHVKRIYDLALSLGGTCEGPPGLRGSGFYAAYFRDLDGHKLNAFCMGTGETKRGEALIFNSILNLRRYFPIHFGTFSTA